MKRVLLFLLVAIFSTSVALIGAPRASAASPWDGFIQNTEPPYVLKSYNGNHNRTFEQSGDIGFYLTSEIETLYNNSFGFCGAPENDLAWFQETLGFIGAGHDYAAYFTFGNNNENGNAIYFVVNSSPVSNTTLDWYDYGGTYGVNLTASSPSLRTFYLQLSNSNNAAVCGDQGSVTTNNYGIGYFIETTFPWNAPPNYEGQVPNQPSSDYFPQFGVVIDDDRRLTATFLRKPTPIFAGRFNVTLSQTDSSYNVTSQLDTREIQNQEVYEYRVPSAGYYLLKIDPVFHPPMLPDPSVKSVTFKLDYSLGRFITNNNIPGSGGDNCSGGVCDPNPPLNFEDCIQEDFPFIDMPGCINNAGKILDLLSFNTISFGAGWIAPTGCYSLQVFDDWVHLENPELCPQFPQEIRDIVTPFVTLGLGLITVMFLTRREGYIE